MHVWLEVQLEDVTGLALLRWKCSLRVCVTSNNTSCWSVCLQFRAIGSVEWYVFV